MEVKDLLLKIAKNENLSQVELDELGRFGTETQQRNALVSGVFKSQEILDVKNIKAVSVEADFVSSLGCRVLRTTSQTIANASGVLIEFGSEVYDDDSMVDLVANNNRVSINTSGRWLVIASCVYTDSGTDLRSLQGVIYNASGSPVGSVATDYSAKYNSVLDMTYLEKGWYIKFTVRQDSGSSKTISWATATLVLMRKTDAGDD